MGGVSFCLYTTKKHTVLMAYSVPQYVILLEISESICYTNLAFTHTEDRAMLESNLSAIWGLAGRVIPYGIALFFSFITLPGKQKR